MAGALAEFDNVEVHRPGKQHTNADSLSRGPDVAWT